MIRRETRIDLLENTVVLAVPPGNPGNIHSFSQLKERLEQGDLLLAMGGGDTPVGQYGEQVLAALGLSGEQLEHNGCVTYGSNAKELVVQLSEGTVDCGLVYATDALAAGLAVVDTAAAGMCSRPIYPAALLTDAPQHEAAQDFLDYIAGEAGDVVFAAAGFLPL
jgi:molybdate transport system substrate-binding protein